MNTIPLIKGNTQEEINTSLIALKKALDEMNSSSSKTDASVQSQIKQINELITDINSQITDLQPVDSVTSGNMQSVTSNAVADCLKYLINTEVDTGKTFNGVKIYRKVVVFGFQQGVSQNITVSNEVPYITYQVVDLSHSYIYNSDWGVRQPWYDTINQTGQAYMSAGVLYWNSGHPNGTAVVTCEYCKQAV